MGVVGLRRPPSRYFFLGGPFRCRRLTSDPHSGFRRSGPLSFYFAPSPFTPLPASLRYVFYPFLCSLSRTALTGLLQTRVILQSEIRFPVLRVFIFAVSNVIPDRRRDQPQRGFQGRRCCFRAATSVKGSYLSGFLGLLMGKFGGPRFPSSTVAVRRNQ